MSSLRLSGRDQCVIDLDLRYRDLTPRGKDPACGGERLSPAVLTMGLQTKWKHPSSPPSL